MYHGTLAKGLTKFDPNLVGSRYSYDEKGFFFIDRKSLADDYSTSEFDPSRKGETISAFLSLKNPLVVNNSWGAENGLGSRVFDDKDAIEFWDNYQSLMLEKSEDRDGIIIDDGTSKMIVALSPNQIKSATDNTGAFDAGNDNILMEGAEDIPARKMTGLDKVYSYLMNSATSALRDGIVSSYEEFREHMGSMLGDKFSKIGRFLPSVYNAARIDVPDEVRDRMTPEAEVMKRAAKDAGLGERGEDRVGTIRVKYVLRQGGM